MPGALESLRRAPRQFLGGRMNSRRGRSIEVDFFRGVVLIVIVIDHISGSALSHVMLHSYAMCDSAEVFVFLGGYASAAAYTAMLAKRGAGAAKMRFLRRSWEIYRAYLLTAMLTLSSGAVLEWLDLNRPMVELTGWPSFSRAPLPQTFAIAVLRHQPYLASVLPMYVVFALSVPVLMPLARRSPMALLASSVVLWAAAPPLATLFSVDAAGGWSFNPFAWQLMFVLGILARLYQVSESFYASDAGDRLTRVAWAVAFGFAMVKLFLLTQPQPGSLKQNLAPTRVINFVAIAWLIALLVHRGGAGWLARRMSAVVTVGRTGLVCFVAGTVVSLIVDTATPRDWHGFTGVLTALAGDLVAIVSILLIARGWHSWRSAHMRATVPAGSE
jgi:hypothetical protein